MHHPHLFRCPRVERSCHTKDFRATAVLLGVVFLGTGLLASAGCTGVAHYHKADGRIIPLHWGDVPPSTQSQARHKLRYDVLYVADRPLSVLGTPWYRFWPGGEVLMGFRDSASSRLEPLTAEDGDTFNNKIVGRYAVTDTHLQVVWASAANGSFGGVVGLAEDNGTVHADGTFTLDFGGGPERRIRFRPKEVGEMERYPDW